MTQLIAQKDAHIEELIDQVFVFICPPLMATD